MKSNYKICLLINWFNERWYLKEIYNICQTTNKQNHNYYRMQKKALIIYSLKHSFLKLANIALEECHFLLLVWLAGLIDPFLLIQQN